MKINPLTHSIHLCMLAAALAAPVAFAQSDTATAAPATIHDGSMQEGTAPPTAPAPAPMASADKPKSWKDLDVNKDGKLSKDEVAADPTWTADFDAVDSNKDGYISKAEYKKHEADLKKVASIDSRK